MLNREKFAKEIVDIACNGSFMAIVDGKPQICQNTLCRRCICHLGDYVCNSGAMIEWANSEYVEPPVDWSKVTVDTPILVRDYDYQDWFKRYFAKFENGVVFSWAEGSTSWSAERSIRWRQAKLAESEGK